MSEPIPLQSLDHTPATTPGLSASSSRVLDLQRFPTHTEPIRDSIADTGTSAYSHDHRRSASPTMSDPETPTTDFFAALPPVDGGMQAWSFLVAATLIEALVWGIPFTIGIFHEYWVNTLFKGESEQTLTLAAALQTGLLYMNAGIVGSIISAFPRWLKTLQFIGLITASAAMIASAFVTKPYHLIVTIGIFYPFCGAAYLPCATLLFEWFHARRGLAAGIMFAGTGLGGSIFPFIVTGLLKTYGYKTAMISLGLGFGIVSCASMYFIKRRIPVTTRQTNPADRRPARKIDWSFMKSHVMMVGVATILTTSMGNFIPSLWLPSFASELHLTKPNGTTLIAIMNAASVPGNALFGYLSDRFPLRWVVFLSCAGSAVSCLFLWGFGTKEITLVFFALGFGLSGLAFAAVWGRIISAISRDEPAAPTIVFSIMTFLRGVGSLSSGPISDALLKSNALKGATGAYGYHNYGALILYAGLTIFAGSITGLGFK